MYGEYLKHLISFTVAPIEVFFIPSPLAFDGLHDNIIFCCTTLVLEVIKEITMYSYMYGDHSNSNLSSHKQNVI